MKNRLKELLVVSLLVLPTMSSALDFYKSGTVSRIIIDTENFGKCMVSLPVTIGNGCAGNFVSLDCEGKYLKNGDGDRMLNVAVIAQTLGKSVSVKIDSTKVINGFCVVKRLDLIN